MCEYAESCTKSDDPLAAPLWTAKGRASWLVLCPPARHPLAAVFDLPDRGQVLCTPGYTMLRRSILIDTREGMELEDPDGLHHMHAGVIPLDEYGADEREYGRCRCGTWSYGPAAITRRLFGHTGRGQPYTLADYADTADSPAARRQRESRHGEETTG